MDSTEKGFRADLAAALRDGDHDGWSVTARIYADWLDEQGHDTRAARLRRAVEGKRAPGVRWPHPRHISGLTPHQRQQLAVALSRPLGILTGTPGTGKTYCTAALIWSILSRHSDVRGLTVCAPTGKAAVRLNSVFGERYRSGYTPARTIHQTLEISRHGLDGERWDFLRNADRPLDARYVIVDEVSMLDTDLAAALFAACRPGTHVLLVGDPNQLPPVGHGAALRDMIAAGVPCGKLTELQRHAGHIVEVCAAIQADERWGPGGNLEHYECHDPAEQIGVLQGVLDQQRRHGRDPVWDVQVLAAVNARGELSRQNLNRLMQEQLNANLPGPQFPWREQDKAVCLRNHWAPLAMANSPHTPGYVANGEIGRVIEIVTGPQAIVELVHPLRRVYVPLRNRTGANHTDSGDPVGIPWDLAYALTAHKSQGSEWPVVVLVIDASSAARQICTREWVYTALSRGKERVITIGKLSVLKHMCKRVSLDQRKTFLTELLSDGTPKR